MFVNLYAKNDIINEEIEYFS